MFSTQAWAVSIAVILALGALVVARHQPRVVGEGSVWTTEAIVEPSLERRFASQQIQGETLTAQDLPLVTLRSAEVPPLTEQSGAAQTNPANVAGESILSSIVAALPHGTLTLDSPPQAEKRSSYQQNLYDYGNAAGRIIEAYQAEYQARQVPIMRDFYADRQNLEKQAAVQKMAKALEEVGDSLRALDSVPSGTLITHQKLARDYVSVGQNLATLSRSATDQSLLESISTYNTSVESLIKDYVALADMFSLAQVTFSNDDPGRVFVFTSASL
ncbi:hypothetical protein EBR66_01890 [bacterium]|nr:hypothetical protein [bacterium]